MGSQHHGDREELGSARALQADGGGDARARWLLVTVEEAEDGAGPATTENGKRAAQEHGSSLARGTTEAAAVAGRREGVVRHGRRPPGVGDRVQGDLAPLCVWVRRRRTMGRGVREEGVRAQMGIEQEAAVRGRDREEGGRG